MPPVRSESWLKSANQEGKIQLALQDIKEGIFTRSDEAI
jgi:hypothetical protein